MRRNRLCCTLSRERDESLREDERDSQRGTAFELITGKEERQRERERESEREREREREREIDYVNISSFGHGQCAST